MGFKLEQKFCFDVNGRFESTCCSHPVDLLMGFFVKCYCANPLKTLSLTGKMITLHSLRKNYPENLVVDSTLHLETFTNSTKFRPPGKDESLWLADSFPLKWGFHQLRGLVVELHIWATWMYLRARQAKVVTKQNVQILIEREEGRGVQKMNKFVEVKSSTE